MKPSLTQLMALKIHPLTTPNESSSYSWSSTTSSTSTFTVWMKSLVMQANGCTVFNEDGEIVYRVDNYDKKGGSFVYLMDCQGNILFTILQKRIWRFRRWRGYKYDGLKAKRPFFNTRRRSGIFGDDSCCEVIVGGQNNNQGDGECLKLETSSGKSAFKIRNGNGGLVAEAKRKLSSTGVLLGDDVLTLKMQTDVDQSLVMALVIVYGLMHRRL